MGGDVPVQPMWVAGCRHVCASMVHYLVHGWVWRSRTCGLRSCAQTTTHLSSTLHWWVQAMHRLGKLVRTAKTFDEGVVDKVLGHPQYAVLQRRTRQIAGTMTPRAMGNFIWGVRAALECSPTYAVVDPG